ncbi:SDR family oxidoreductase [Novosphingobium flavum]|uniref:SDR family oxidoreductase n=1 Tax=Novosphingobium flavum TaxID=1778672 RepID=A0A7X1FT53_9SPHN|nr:SDR family oxidoreductase [Novosphingobium flavum]MBC2666514.1 SDR family oxidoreductase [Novosphingobium flavum]
MTRPAILITGGAKRIGSLVARRFARAGWHVVIHYGQSEAAARALAESLPSAEVVCCDLSRPDEAEAMAMDLAGRLEDWRMLVNSAAVFRFDTAERLDPAVLAEAAAVNAEAPARLAQAFLRSARARGGRRVVDLLDQKLVNLNPDFFSYTMAKAAFAAAMAMQAMALTAPADRVYGLAPGAMLPSFDQAPDEHQVSGRMNLLGRLNDPQELAEAALFLSEGWLASGQTLFIDSGQHLLRQPRDVLYLARGLA